MVTVIGDPYYNDENALRYRLDDMGYADTYSIERREEVAHLYVSDTYMCTVTQALGMADDDLKHFITLTLTSGAQ